MTELLAPDSLEALLPLMDGSARLVAGGTDWFVRHGRDPWGVTRLVDLSGVGALLGIALEDGALTVGAGETMARVAAHPLVHAHAACLAEAASSVGSWQIRSRATLGGNLANASPAADTPPALAALGASARILSPRGPREAEVQTLIDEKDGALGADELLLAFRIPVSRCVSAFGKVGSRREVSIARLNLAVCASSGSAPGTFGNARVVIGTLGNAGRRCPAAEAALALPDREGQRDAFCAALADAVDAAIPGRSTRPYKRSAVQALGEDTLDRMRRRALGEEALS